MRERGFTLLEMLITVATLGVVLALLSPVFDAMTTAQRRANDDKQQLIHLGIVNGLSTFANNVSTTGRLPAPYTGGGLTSGVYNPGDTSAAGLALAAALTESGNNPFEINTDNTAAANVRVYQRVAGLTINVPLYFQSGPVATLTYDFGAVYLTQCPLASTATCNPTPATGVPGTSPILTAANMATWTTTGTDSRPLFVSSLPVQKAMLASTAARLDKIRDALLNYVRVQQITASGSDTTNWFPNQAGNAANGSLVGADPLTNQGCRDGWYSLNSGSVLVLTRVGLSQAEYGTTAWGGPIEYCRKYAPNGLIGASATPHYAALRILAAVSSGGAPDSVTPANNIVLTF